MLVQFGAIVVAGSGKLGGHVFAKNRGGDYMRTKVTPLNPQSTRQTIVRALFASISSAWSSLTAPNRQSYEDKVGEYAKTNIFGQLKNPSGKALHQRLNQNLQNTGQAIQTTAPDPVAVPDAGFTTALYGLLAGNFLLALSGNTTGQKIIVYATPQMSQGTNFVKNRLRQLEIFDGVDAATLDIKASYDALFGLPEPGSNIHIKVVVVNVNGQASPGTTVKAIVVA